MIDIVRGVIVEWVSSLTTDDLGDDIARAVLAISSDDVPYMTGAFIEVDGGLTAGYPLRIPELLA